MSIPIGFNALQFILRYDRRRAHLLISGFDVEWLKFVAIAAFRYIKIERFRPDEGSRAWPIGLMQARIQTAIGWLLGRGWVPRGRHALWSSRWANPLCRVHGRHTPWSGLNGEYVHQGGVLGRGHCGPLPKRDETADVSMVQEGPPSPRPQRGGRCLICATARGSTGERQRLSGKIGGVLHRRSCELS